MLLYGMETTIIIPRAELRQVNAWVSGGSPIPDAGHDEVVKTYTAKFENGNQVDIKVCNGDQPYVDPVLFGSDGTELDIAEPRAWVEGEYHFDDGDEEHIVFVKSDFASDARRPHEAEDAWLDSYMEDRLNGGYGDVIDDMDGCY